MKIKTILDMAFIVCFFFGVRYNWAINIAAQENIKQKELEDYLSKARIVSVQKDIAAGRTAAWIITLDDGKIARRGFFKYINRQRPALPPDSYKYEIAAYELNKLLGLNLIPPVVEREIEGVKGSLQLFVEGSIRETERKMRNIEPPEPKSFENTLEEMAIFENLCCCLREDLGDILIQTATWKVWRVDFSEAFSPSPELFPRAEINHCSRKLFQNLQKLEDNIVRAKLKPYLNEEEIGALLERKNIILEKIRKLIEEKGEGNVLFS